MIGLGKDRSLRVAHVVLSLDVGGLERVVLNLALRGRSLGQDVSVICLERPGTLAPQVEASGAEVLSLGKPPGRRPETVGKLRDVFARIKPDVIHTHQIGALFYAGPAASRAGVSAVVHTEHNNHAAVRTNAVGRIKVRVLWCLAGRHARRFFVVSPDIVGAVSAFGAVPREKLSVVRNGIDTSAFAASGETRAEASETLRRLGVPGTAEVVGTVGRLAEVKRQDVLIRGFALAAVERPRAHLVLVGEGPERVALEALARSLDVAGRVHFAGYRERPEGLFAWNGPLRPDQPGRGASPGDPGGLGRGCAGRGHAGRGHRGPDPRRRGRPSRPCRRHPGRRQGDWRTPGRSGPGASDRRRGPGQGSGRV